jgi:hypothetical protein
MNRRKNASGAKVISGAELRRRREERAAAIDPKAEAQRRETSLLKSLSTAREDFDWFVGNRAWEPLGFETFTDWWAARVQPVADGLMKPVREVARTAIDLMTEEQKALPPAQRIPQRKIAAMVGAAQSTVSRRSRDADASEADLDPSVDVDEQAGVPDPRPAGPDGSTTPPVDPSTQTENHTEEEGTAWAADSSTQTAAEEGADIVLQADGVEGGLVPPVDTPAPAGGVPGPPPAGVTPETTAVERTTAVDSTLNGSESHVEGSALPVDPSTRDTPAAEHGDDLREPDGNAGRQQPGVHHPHRVAGEVSTVLLTVDAGAQPSVPLGEAGMGDETAGGLPDLGSSAVGSRALAFIDGMAGARAAFTHWSVRDVAALGEAVYAALTETRDFYDEVHLMVTRVKAGLDPTEDE